MMIRIPLSQTSQKYKGLYEALIDDDDKILLKTRWCVSIFGEWVFAKNQTGMLARAVVENMLQRALARNEIVDFVNGNSLDCRRENLVIRFKVKVRKIRKLAPNSTSGFSGVVLHVPSGLWQARIRVDGKTLYLGYRKTAQAAYEELRLPAEEKYGL